MYLRELKTDVSSIAYNFDNKHGVLNLPACQCSDMTQAVELFKKIDPDVRSIQTYSGYRPDILYRRDGKDKWWATGRPR